MTSRRKNVVRSLPSARRHRAVVVSPRRSVRQALALGLSEYGFEVLSFESDSALPWLAHHRVSEIEAIASDTVYVDGEIGRALTVVDVLRAQGLDCPVRIVAGTNLDGTPDTDRDVA